MAPSKAASGDLQGSTGRYNGKHEDDPIFLQADKLAIHARPRSPRPAPAKYLPVDANLDVKLAKDANARPVLHLEVAGARRAGVAVDTQQPAPRAVVDVFHVQPYGVPAAAQSQTPSGPHLPAAVSITVLPAGGQQRPAFTGGALEPRSRQHGASSATRKPVHVVPPLMLPGRVSGSTAQAPASRGFAPATAASAPAASQTAHGLFAAAKAAAATAAAAPPAPQGARIAKGGGAALLAELLGTHSAMSSQQPAAVANTRSTIPDPDRERRGPRFRHEPFHSVGPASFNFDPGALPPDRAGGFLRESLGLAWSQEGLVPSALAGISDPDEEARRARRRHRKRVARIVVDHWKQFAREGLRAVAARRHRRRRLLTAAWIAWQAETAAVRSRMRLAAVYDMKRSYLGLGLCVQAWRAAAKRLAQLRELQERMVVSRLLRRTRACWRAWRGRCQYAAEKRRRQLQAWFYYCFSTLTRALRKWHSWAARRRAKARRAAWAAKLHVAALGRRVFAAWRRRLALRRWKGAASERAAAFRCVWALRHALWGWRAGAAACRTARDVASAALRAVAAGIEAHQAAAAFLEWRAYAAQRRRRCQRERYALAYMRRWWQLVAMWSWRQLAARRSHLRVCERELRRVGARVRLGLWWSRWWLAVEVLQGQRNSELRAAVLSRACWATWRAVVEHGVAKRELLQTAIRRVGRVKVAAALAAWRARAAYWQAKAARWARAVSWHRRRALTRLLQGWRSEADRLAAKAVVAQAAEQHRRWVVLARTVLLWRHYAWRQFMKQVVAEYRPRRLLGGAMRGWLRHTRYKARKELDRRRAVRHRYLSLLHLGFRAFRGMVQRRIDKQRDWADLARLHGRHVARAVLRAWRHDFVPVAAAKRAVGRLADRQRRAALLRRVVAGWALEAARLAAKHARQREAAGFASLQLLRRALRRWAAAPALQEARRAAKAGRLASLVAALADRAARRLFAAWREVHADLVMRRFQDSRARAAWRGRTLHRAMTAWALHLAHRRASGLRNARALGFFRERVWRTVLAGMAAHAAAQRAKRRRLAVASEHLRMGLLRKGIAALSWYGKYRAAKARGYAAARAHYVRRLQREGAVAWLEAGMERRQQRIEVLAAIQARSLAQQLARVEPFARRWLHLVRARRRRQLAGWLPFSTTSTSFGPFPDVAAAIARGPGLSSFAFAGGSAAGLGDDLPLGAAVTVAAGAAGRRAGAVQRTTAPTGGAGLPLQGSSMPGWTRGQGPRLRALGLDGQPVVVPSDAIGDITLAHGLAGGGRERAAGGGDAATAAVAPVGPAAAAAWRRRPPPRTPLAGHGGLDAPGAAGFAPGSAAPPRASPPPGPDAQLRAPLRSLNTLAAAAAVSGPDGGGIAPKPAGPGTRRARPAPRCPDFLLGRPATVGGGSLAAGSDPQRVRDARPASSAALGGRQAPAPAAAWAPEATLSTVPSTDPSTAAGGGIFTTAPAWAAAAGAGAGYNHAPSAPSMDRAAAAQEAMQVEEPAGVRAGIHFRPGSSRSSAGWLAGCRPGAASLGGQPAPPPLFFANLPFNAQAQSGASSWDGGGVAGGGGPGSRQGYSCGPADAAPSRNPHPSAAWSGAAAPSGSGALPRAAGSHTGPRHPAASYCERPDEHAGNTDTDGVESPSPSFSSGITIHRPGPGPPDVFRLPTRGEMSSAGGEELASDAAAAGAGRSAFYRYDGRPQGASPQRHQQPAFPQSHHQRDAAPHPSQQHPALGSWVQHWQLQEQDLRQDAPPPPPQAMPPPPRASQLDDAELSELQSVLLHCKRLKGLLQDLESGDDAAEWGDINVRGAGAGGGADAGRAAGGQVAEAEAAARRQQAAELRAALAALRPTVEYAAARLRQIRGLA